MEELGSRVAVVTGAASGIGRGMARAFATEGMRLVLSDIEEAALEGVAEELRGRGAELRVVPSNVADASSVDTLAEASFDAFGAVHLLCNNAGVINDNVPTWESSAGDWEWVMGVNMMGVAHGIRAFVPRMLAGGEAGHIVNTSSMGGLISGTANAIYIASKHAVVSISECVQNELRWAEAPIGVSVLCPGWVRTGLVDADRNRRDAPQPSEAERAMRARFQRGLDRGADPDAVGRLVVDAVRRERFYVLTHPHWDGLIRARFDAILDGERPAAERFPKS